MRKTLLDKSLVSNRGTRRFKGSKSVAGNAGSTVLGSLAIGVNQYATVTGHIRASVGAPGAAVAIASANTTTEVVTTSAAHGLVTGTPVNITVTTGLTGITQTTTYFVNVASSTTFLLYDTIVNAAAGGATGKVDISADGTGTVTPTTANASYMIRGAIRNRNGRTSLVGSVDVLALEDVASWVGTVVANDTTDTLDVTGTPDPTLTTKFEWDLTVVVDPLDVVL